MPSGNCEVKSEELKGTKDKAKVLSLDDCVVLLEREKMGGLTSSESSLKNAEFQRNGRCTKKARRKGDPRYKHKSLFGIS